ncbi:MAG TPA: thioredoxin [Candidatus Altiarchaeales archaeon]|nr:thioredoxin [Candidatus Altiarchaeales archaeon]
MVEETTDAGFKKILEENSLVLLDLWAPWCMPCQKLGPVIEELSREVKEAKFVKINIDENKQTARENNVMSIPTIIIYKDGKSVERITGFVPKDSIKAKLQGHF